MIKVIKNFNGEGSGLRDGFYYDQGVGDNRGCGKGLGEVAWNGYGRWTGGGYGSGSGYGRDAGYQCYSKEEKDKILSGKQLTNSIRFILEY